WSSDVCSSDLVHAADLMLEVRIPRVSTGGLLAGDVDEPGAGVVRHRMPAVRAVRTGREALSLRPVAGFRRLDGPAGDGIQTSRPRYVDEGLAGDELARLAIDDVEEPVLRRLQQHLAGPAVDDEIGQDDRLRAGVVPVVRRRLLEVPDVLAGRGTQRDDGAQKQVVAAAGAA